MSISCSAVSTISKACLAVRAASAFNRPEGCWLPLRSARPDGPLTVALHALAAQPPPGPKQPLHPPRPADPGPWSGIDYLTQLAQNYRRQLLHDLGVADPDGVFGVTVTGWPLVNAVTGGALLTTPGG